MDIQGRRLLKSFADRDVWLLFTVLVFKTCFANSLWPEDVQRLNVGINVLPACLIADLALSKKLTPSGKLRILVLHKNDYASALSVSEGLLALKTIGGYPIEIVILSTSERQEPYNTRVAALFIASPGIKPEIFNNWIRHNQTTVFSPFTGDVERGAIAGLYVTDRILPYINISQAKRAGVIYKPFFLRIAKQYDE